MSKLTNSLRRIPVAATVALALISLVLLVALPLQFATDALDEEAETRVADVAATNALAIDERMNALRRIVETYGNSITSGPQTNLNQVLANLELTELRAANPDVFTAYVIDTTGIPVRVDPTPENFQPQSLADRDYFQQSMASDYTVISGAFISRSGTQKIAVVAKALRNDAGQPIGVLAAAVDVNKVFQEYVDTVSALRGADIAIYDASGGVVARPGIGTLTEEHDDNVELHSGVGGKPWIGSEHIDGKSVLAAYAPASSTGWRVGAFVDTSSAFAPINDLRSRTIAWAAVLGLLILLGAAILTREIRARGKAEQTLTQTEKHMDDVMDAAGQMIIEMDTAGRIVSFNRKVEEMTGLGLQDAGQYVYDVLVPQSERDRIRGIFDALIQAPEISTWSHRGEGLMVVKGGILNVEAHLWTAIVDRRIRVFGLFQDISERKRLENARENVFAQQHRLVEELRQMDKTKSDFVSTVSHELRTPLTSIIGYLEMMMEGYGGELNDQQTSMLGVIDRNSRRLLRLIEDLLTLSRIESGNLKLEHFDLDVNHLVVNAVQAVIPSANDKSLELSIDVPTDVGIVRGDPNQLERVLLNLVSNAIKFTPEGGHISVVADRHDGGVRMCVTDTGMGIPKEDQAKLFSRFYRSAKAQEMAIQGTGLGLAIVHSIVQLHNGRVSVDSEPDRGTTVTVWLPEASAVPAGRL